MDEIIRCGFLTKKGAFKVGGWKRRYFVLRMSGGKSVLSYYRKQGDTTAAGEIVLDQSTLAYHNTESEKPFAFNIQTKSGRTYEIYASSQAEMQDWIETLMRSALGIVEKKKPLQMAAASMDNPWLKLEARGMMCEHCWEAVPEALKEIPGVETVRIDAGNQIVSVKRADGSDATELLQKVVSLLEERYGYLVSVAK